MRPSLTDEKPFNMELTVIFLNHQVGQPTDEQIQPNKAEIGIRVNLGTEVLACSPALK